MKKLTAGFVTIVLVAVLTPTRAGSNEVENHVLSVLLVDGQNDHDWRATSPIIRQILEGSGRFRVTVATAPAEGEPIDRFDPTFSKYDVVVSNYHGEAWSEKTRQAFLRYVSNGGGFVGIHAANPAIPQWKSYVRMVDSDEALGEPMPLPIVVRDTQHPITKGLPDSFMQVADRLHVHPRRDFENDMHVLATGYNANEIGGRGAYQPALLTSRYGAGRVFRSTLGHDREAMLGLAFQVTLQRGTEWAATGAVTFESISNDALTFATPAIRDPARIESQATDEIPNIHETGWTELFNGRDLTGWVERNGTATYRVEEGMIVGKTSEGSPNSFLCTESEYSDFELTLEVNNDLDLNSGVQIRSLSTSEFKNGRVHGPQVEIESSPGESGYLYSEGTGRGWITKEQPIKDAHQNGQWNRYVIRAQGERIQIWVNGRIITDVQDPESSNRGFIGLQVHGIPRETGPYEVRWRDLRIRDLSTKQP